MVLDGFRVQVKQIPTLGQGGNATLRPRSLRVFFFFPHLEGGSSNPLNKSRKLEKKKNVFQFN